MSFVAHMSLNSFRTDKNARGGAVETDGTVTASAQQVSVHAKAGKRFRFG